jgi:hypothetical protein
VLILLIPVAWLAILAFGVTMFRLAARSDRCQAAALAEWVTTSYFAGAERAPATDGRAPQVPFDGIRGSHRALG